MLIGRQILYVVGAVFGPMLAGVFLFFCRDVNFRSGAIDMNNYHMRFVICATLFLITHFLRRHLRAEREKPTVEVITIITRPLRNILGPFVALPPASSRQSGLPAAPDPETPENNTGL